MPRLARTPSVSAVRPTPRWIPIPPLRLFRGGGDGTRWSPSALTFSFCLNVQLAHAAISRAASSAVKRSTPTPRSPALHRQRRSTVCSVRYLPALLGSEAEVDDPCRRLIVYGTVRRGSRAATSAAYRKHSARSRSRQGDDRQRTACGGRRHSPRSNRDGLRS